MKKLVPFLACSLLVSGYHGQAHHFGLRPARPIFSSLAAINTPAPAPQQVVAGTVVDEKGEGLPGVSIAVKGTTTGTVTDATGAFQLTVPGPEAVLVIRYVGYVSQEITVGSQAAISVKLVRDAKQLDDVVVGYGTQSKREVTGAVQTVKAQELADIPAAQVTQKLQGKLAGVQILHATGKPGQGMQVRIRGQASISAGSEPLYVVDGFPIVTDISLINPDEIETITVLKDAASTSLYGSRAANGVVLVTIKQAKNGQSSVGVNAYFGVQQVPQKGRPDMMNGTEFAQFKKETYKDLGQPVPAVFQNPAQYGEGYNWCDAMLRNAPVQNYSITLTAGKDKFSTSAVAGYFNQQGVVLNSNYQRFSLRLNSSYNVSDKVRVGLNLAPSYTIDNTPSTDGAFATGQGLLYNAMLAWPTLAYQNPDGSLPLSVSVPGVTTFTEPNWYRSIQEIRNTNTQTRVLSNAYLEVEPVKDLLLKTTINLDLGSALFDNFNPFMASIGFATPPPVTASALRRNNQYYSWLNENTATYRKVIGDHTFDLLAGYTLQRFHSDFDQVRATNFPDDRIQTIQSAINIDRPNTYSDIQEWSLVSYIGRANQVLSLIDDAAFDQTARNTIKGEALFLRALAYTELVQFYGQVPLHLVPVTERSQTALPLPSTDDIYKQIVADAQLASTLLPGKAAQTPGRATAGAAKTLLGNVYLLQKQYASAETVLKSVVSPGDYALLPSYAAVFDPANKNSSESVFEVQYLAGTEGYASNFIYQFLPRPMSAATVGALTGVSNPQGLLNLEGFNTPTPDLIAAYEAGDRRKDASIGYAPVVGGTQYPYTKKYLHPHTQFGITNDNWPVYRYAEVLLLLAEALTEQGKAAEALPLLNQVRLRAGLATTAAADQAVLPSAIARERRVELVFENKRWLDLVRTGQAVVTTTAHGAKIKANPRAYYLPPGVTPLPAAFSTISLVFPLPASESLVSPYF